MKNLRLLEDIFVRDPYFVRTEKGWRVQDMAYQ